MLHKDCFSPSWIAEQAKILNCGNPVLLEKAIVALQLVGHLAEADLAFQFKGGTSMLLLVEPLRRLSIDVDIVTQATAGQLEAVLGSVSKLQPFQSYEHDQDRDRDLPPKKHYRMFYPSVFPPKANHILLDVLFETAGLAEPRIIRTPFIQTERQVSVQVPGINRTLGDKLSAFAPTTIGIIYDEKRTADIVKQLFDVAILFDAATDLADAAAAYNEVHPNQCRYRNRQFTLEETLTDTINACVELSQHDLRGAPRKDTRGPFFLDGIEKIQGHLLNYPFRHAQARVAAGKVACAAAWMMRRPNGVAIGALRSSPARIGALTDRVIQAPWAPLSRLKAGNPEAFLYWSQAQRLLNGEIPW